MSQNLKKYLIEIASIALWVVYITHSFSPTDISDSKDTTSKSVKTEQTKALNKPKYIKPEIQDQIDEVISKVDGAIDTEATTKSDIQKAMDSGDTLGAYDKAKTAASNADDVFSDLSSIKIPDSVPAETNKILTDAIQNMKESVTQDQLGYKDMMKFMDSGKTSDLSDAKSKFEMSNQFVNVAQTDEDDVIAKNK